MPYQESDGETTQCASCQAVLWTGRYRPAGPKGNAVVRCKQGGVLAAYKPHAPAAAEAKLFERLPLPPVVERDPHPYEPTRYWVDADGGKHMVRPPRERRRVR